MGDWDYYLCVLKMADAATRIRSAEEIHDSETLNDLLQRRLTNRSKSIASYLLGQQQRLFNAMVIGVYEGNPRFAEIELRNTEHEAINNEQAERLEGLLGYLILNGSERLFAIDGQHRIYGIRDALAINPHLGEEEVSVIFVGHSNTKKGKKRTRRLFTTLNRYAKPVSKGDIIALDEDDIVAIVTRMMVTDFPLFKDSIASNLTKNLPPGDKNSFTSIVALYDALDAFLTRGSRKTWLKFRRFRPEDDTIVEFYTLAYELFDLMTKHFNGLRKFSKMSNTQSRASNFRHDKGGDLLFRPIGLEMLVKVITHMGRIMSLEKAVKFASKAPLELSMEPWVGLLWEHETEKMITANKSIAEMVLYFGLVGDLSPYRGWNETRLRKEVAGKLNVTQNKVQLQRFI